MLQSSLFFLVLLAAGPTSSESELNKVKLAPEAAQRIGIELGAVEKGLIPRVMRVPGTIIPCPGGSATIVAPFSGIIVAPAHLHQARLPGKTVLAEETVWRLRPIVAPTGTMLTETKREMKQAEARFETAKKSVVRADTLLKNGAGDRAGLDAAEEVLQVAEAELHAAKERLDRAEKSPMSADVSMPLRAPMGGMLTRLYVSAGQSVAQGERLADIVDLAKLWARAEVYEGAIERINPKAAVTVHPLGSNSKALRAAPVGAPPVARAPGTVVEIDYEIDSPLGLVPFSRAKIDLPIIESAEEVLSVPWSAVLYDVFGGAWLYVAIDQTTFERRRIQVEAISGDRAILSKGPISGTQVVVAGASELFAMEFGIGK